MSTRHPAPDGAGPEGAAEPAALARLREIHLRMVGGVLAGGGLERLAEVASDELRAPVAIVISRVGEAIAPARALNREQVARLHAFVRDRLGKRPAEVPDFVAAETLVTSGAEDVGVAVVLSSGDDEKPAAGALDVLNVLAIAALTEVAVSEVRDETEQALRSSLIELIRGNPDLSEEDLLRRAYRLDSDLSRGAVALCAEIKTNRPRYVMSLIRDREPRALAEQLHDRIYALIPAGEGEDAARAALASTREIAKAIAPYALAAFSSFCDQPRAFHRAIQEAELVLDVIRHGEGGDAAEIDSDTYRLLVRTLASHPDEVMRFYDDTVAPLVRYDEQYATDLVGTVEAYLAHNCNMNATAAAIYAHRHTIAYRLDRVRELTSLDPNVSEDRERLGLGLKAYRLLAPRLQR
jgi:sugar diacid utilization regulator